MLVLKLTFILSKPYYVSICAIALLWKSIGSLSSLLKLDEFNQIEKYCEYLPATITSDETYTERFTNIVKHKLK